VPRCAVYFSLSLRLPLVSSDNLLAACGRSRASNSEVRTRRDHRPVLLRPQSSKEGLSATSRAAFLRRLTPPLRRSQVTAALRDFDPAYDRFGSIAPDRPDRDARPMSAPPPIAVKHWQRSATPLCAKRRHMHRTKDYRYSITSSAMASSLSGTVSPSALAVLRLITSSYLVGACTGRSAGFSPLRMRST
jgi:hypothetical protein